MWRTGPCSLPKCHKEVLPMRYTHVTAPQNIRYNPAWHGTDPATCNCNVPPRVLKQQFYAVQVRHLNGRLGRTSLYRDTSVILHHPSCCNLPFSSTLIRPFPTLTLPLSTAPLTAPQGWSTYTWDESRIHRNLEIQGCRRHAVTRICLRTGGHCRSAPLSHHVHRENIISPSWGLVSPVHPGQSSGYSGYAAG